MDLALLVYAISLLHGIGTFFVASLIISGALAFALFLFRVTDGTPAFYNKGTEREEIIAKGKTAEKWIWRCLINVIISAWVLILLPTEKTAYTMVGAYAAQKVTENEKVQQMSGKVLKIIEQKLDGYIDQGLEEAEKKVTEEVEKKTKRKSKE